MSKMTVVARIFLICVIIGGTIATLAIAYLVFVVGIPPPFSLP